MFLIGDDLVPRCSLANVDRLRHEMKTQYEKASDAKLYKVYIGRHHKEKKDALIPWEDQEPSSFGTGRSPFLKSLENI